MDETKIVFLLIIVGIIIFVIYEIYNSARQNQEQVKEEELKKQREEQEQIKNTERRKKESYKWNELIQSKYNEKLLKDKYKTNKKLKVLIGDYTDSMAPYTNSVLKSMGIETEIVPTTSDIIDRINDGKMYDVIITNNVYKNGESGQQVVSTLKDIDGFKIPIIILTVDQDARDKYLSMGFDEYIPKPLDEDKVMETFKAIRPDIKFTKIKSNKS